MIVYNKTILLVEGARRIALHESDILMNNGFTAITVHSGEAAINAVRDSAVDLVLMDIDLGGGMMDGTETGRRILEEYDIPVIFLSSRTEPEAAEKTENIAPYGCVEKNSGETILITAIKTAFKLHQARLSLKEKEAELSAIYEHTPSLMIMLDKERRIRKANASASLFAGTCSAQLFGKRCGEALQCRNHLDDPRGCGYGPSCKECPVRLIVEDTLNNGKTTRQTEASLPFMINGKEQRVIFFVSTSLVHLKGETFVLVSMEDITELKESKKLLQRELGSILYPEYEIDHINIENIIDWEEIQGIMGAFTEAIGVGMGLTDLEGNILVTSGLQRICTDFHKNHPEMKNRCIERDKEFTLSLKKGEIAEVKCRNNLWDLATPLFIADKRVGTIYCGQFLYEDEHIDYDFFRKQAETFGLDKEAYLSALKELPRRSRETIQRAMAFFIKFVECISAMGYRNLTLVRLHHEQKLLAEQLRTSEERYRALFDFSPFGIAEIDADGNILTANKAATSRFGAEPHEQIGKNRADIVPKDVAEYRNKQSRKALETNTIVRFVDEDRGMKLRYTVVPMVSGGKPTVQCISEDITEQEKTADRLREIIQEKEYLMKEINHRVKNNLLMISSLINLKVSSMKDVVDLSDIQHQVDAIRIVHEKLYLSDDITHIDFGPYTSELLSTIFDSFSAREVVINNTIKTIKLPTKRAIPLGLILNELATNAMKHGFDPAVEPRFTLKMEHDSRYVMTVSNSGKPFPPHIEMKKAETLGLRLINALTDQLKGTIELEREPETTFIISFPAS